MKKSYRAISVIATVALAATALVAGTSAAQAASKVLTISTDLPLQGSSFDSNDSTNKAIALYLKQIKYKAGKFTVKLKIYDDATAAKGGWDDAKCAANAQAHVANKSEVAVMGTYNSGCAKIIVPILNQAPGGAMTMVSNANTNPGLTKTWDPGEPGVFYPTGARNYARVCTTDDVQGAAAAQFAKSIGIKSVYVLNDTQTYGQGVAQAFTAEAKKQGLNVLSSGSYGEGWDAKQSSYEALFTKVKALNPDMVYIAGIFDNNGGQLVKDKFKVLGDNTVVKMMAPDGFTGYPDFNTMPEADGAYLSFAGLSTELLLKNSPNGAGAKFIKAYKAEYKADPVGSYPIYGVAAVQVILAALAKSDGTRKGLTKQIFSGKGITIPAGLSVLGKALVINPKTGDTSAKDITIEQVKGGAETTVKAWTVK
ncbi:MAG: branched-chain amino acid ABC transporter substrate-binding protein [Candidatus Nanopelagicaceae bacterium]|nr:branched-chain amino acid ABC transporter substrate-binding protein [Candidatus Nanopelagicaceae bacterium]